MGTVTTTPGFKRIEITDKDNDQLVVMPSDAGFIVLIRDRRSRISAVEIETSEAQILGHLLLGQEMPESYYLIDREGYYWILCADDRWRCTDRNEMAYPIASLYNKTHTACFVGLEGAAKIIDAFGVQA